jgi:hypothetical protein
LIASGSGEEEIVMLKGVTKSFYPAVLNLRCEQLKTSLIGTNKIFYQCKHFFCLQEEAPQEKKSAITTAENAVKKLEVVLSTPPPKRNRPGERWIKRKDGPDKWRNKTIITIKL